MLINDENRLVQGVLKHGPEILENCVTDSAVLKKYQTRLLQEHLNYPEPKIEIDITNWFVPREYSDLDIEQFLVDRCPNENLDRLNQELELYKKNNMIPVLKAMKYIVDKLRENHIVWGVGRGSSVSSYVLFLIGIHKIDSVKYKLPITEFFKGE
jgi:DNA polymerase III alpha subunit